VTDYPDDGTGDGTPEEGYRLRTSEPDDYVPRHAVPRQGSGGGTGHDEGAALGSPAEIGQPGGAAPGYTDGYDGYGDSASYEGYSQAGGEPGYDSAGYEAAGYGSGAFGSSGWVEARYNEAGYRVPGPGEAGYVEADYLAAQPAYPSGGYDPRGEASTAGYRPGTYDGGELEEVAYGEPGYDDAEFEEVAYGEAGYGPAAYDGTGYDPAGYDPADYDGGDGGAGDYGGADFDGTDFESTDFDDTDFDDTDYDEADYDDGGAYEDEDGYGADDGAPPPPVAGGAHRQHSAGGRRRPPAAEFRRRRILAVLAFIVVVLVIAGGIGVIYARRQINPGGSPGPVVSVKIPQNASSSKIGKILAKAGVIHDGSLFPYYVKLTSSTGLLPGEYRLKQNQSYGKVVNELQQGPTLITDKLVIPEGFTLAQIAARVAALPGLHLSAAKFLAAGTSGEVRSIFEPAGSNNLEGLAFPATYEVQQGQAEVDILSNLVNTFDARAKELGIVAAAAKLHMTPYQVITVASIVEREAKLEGDRGNVASTIYNRLAKGMTLGADSTQTYYLRLTDPTLQPSVAQLNAPSPYNTRLNTGLPPTPIANPGIPSLQAAIDPPTTTYLYFVEINPDGKLGFGTTQADFTKLESECQAAKLC
jgi:UPF0755 protein